MRSPEPPALAALRAGLALYDRERSDSTPGAVAVVATRHARRLARLVSDRFPGSDLLVLTSSDAQGAPRGGRTHVSTFASADDLRLRLLEHARPDLVIDTTKCRAPPSAKRLSVLLFTLIDGGAYLSTGRAGTGADPIERALDPYATALRRLMSLGARATSSDEAEELRCGTLVTSMVTDGDVLLVGKSGHHYAKLDEDVTTPVLTRRFGSRWGRELHVRPPEVLQSRADVTSNVSASWTQFPAELHVPAMHLREYRDAVCAPHQLVVSGPFVVPASFHHPSSPRRSNITIQNTTKHFAEIDIDLDRAPDLPGTYFHLDSEYPAHFGHVFTEDIAKLWGWDLAKRRWPDLRVLRSSSTRDDCRPASFLVEALGAYGIAESDIVCFDRPVRVERLVTASQEFHNGPVLYVSAQLADTWDRLREGLRSGAARRVEKIFVARAGSQRRACLNGARLEATFVEHGFEVVRPELLPLGEQAELFATACVVAGYAGSGLFNTIYSERPGRRIVIASESYPARNEYLISAVKGDDYHHFSCPSVRGDRSAMHHDFQFDFDRDGKALEKLLTTA